MSNNSTKQNNEVVSELENDVKNSEKSEVNPQNKLVNKMAAKRKRKKIGKTLLIILIALAAFIFAALKMGLFDKLFSGKNDISHDNLSIYSVSQRTITKTLTSSGTIEPNDSYTITPRVSGEIIADYFEEGDTVHEDQILYEIETGNLDSSVERAENSLEKAKTALEEAMENLENLDVTSDFTGTVQKLYVQAGDDVMSGQVIADVVDKSVMRVDIPFIAPDAEKIKIGDTATLTFDISYETLFGTVVEISPITNVNSFGVLTREVTISVNNAGAITPQTTAYASIGDAVCTANGTFYYNDEGQIKAQASGQVDIIYFDEGSYIRKNQMILRLSNTSLENQIRNLELSLDDARSSLDDSIDAYDDYNITSPISGTVISKDYKAGDTLAGGNSGAVSMAVIYDMSAFKFQMSIDELDIDFLTEGQDVVVTSEAREGKEYHGKITNISIQGTTSNGTTVYPVTVTIENVEDEDLRVVDEDGTIHKTYKTGKTSVTKNYLLENMAAVDGTTVYTYKDDVEVCVEADENGKPIITSGGRTLTLQPDGRYNSGKKFYEFSEDFSQLVLETTDESKMLKPGMNIDADIVVEKVENAVAVPVSAVMRGYTVKVIKAAASKNSDKDVEDSQKSQQKNNPTEIPDTKNVPFDFNPENTTDAMKSPDENNVPEQIDFSSARAPGGKNKDITDMSPGDYGSTANTAEYEEVKVEIGINDDEFVEIKSGLEVGDIVILDEINAIGIGNSGNNTQGSMTGFGNMGGGMPSMGGMGGHPF